MTRPHNRSRVRLISLWASRTILQWLATGGISASIVGACKDDGAGAAFDRVPPGTIGESTSGAPAPDANTPTEATETDAGDKCPEPLIPVPDVLPKPPATPFVSNPSFPDCVHPGVEQDCENGWCRIPAGCFIWGSPEWEVNRGLNSEEQSSPREPMASNARSHSVRSAGYRGSRRSHSPTRCLPHTTRRSPPVTLPRVARGRATAPTSTARSCASPSFVISRRAALSVGLVDLELGLGATYENHWAPGADGSDIIRHSIGPAGVARLVALQRLYFALELDDFGLIAGRPRR